MSLRKLFPFIFKYPFFRFGLCFVGAAFWPFYVRHIMYAGQVPWGYHFYITYSVFFLISLLEVLLSLSETMLLCSFPLRRIWKHIARLPILILYFWWLVNLVEYQNRGIVTRAPLSTGGIFESNLFNLIGPGLKTLGVFEIILMLVSMGCIFFLQKKWQQKISSQQHRIVPLLLSVISVAF